jgi:hypothetical protein
VKYKKLFILKIKPAFAFRRVEVAVAEVFFVNRENLAIAGFAPVNPAVRRAVGLDLQKRAFEQQAATRAAPAALALPSRQLARQVMLAIRQQKPPQFSRGLRVFGFE